MLTLCLSPASSSLCNFRMPRLRSSSPWLQPADMTGPQLPPSRYYTHSKRSVAYHLHVSLTPFGIRHPSDGTPEPAPWPLRLLHTEAEQGGSMAPSSFTCTPLEPGQ